MDNERATEQLSGRVTDSQKSYITSMEGSFSEKIAELIELHKNRVENDVFTISPNLDAVQKAVNTIVKNLEVIELNANTYVTDYNNQIAAKLAVLETEGIELKEIKEENERLTKVNEALISECEKSSITNENLQKTLENKEVKISELVGNNNNLLQDKIKNKEDIETIRLNQQEKVAKLEGELNLKVNEARELDKENSIKDSTIVALKEAVVDLKGELKEIRVTHREEIKELDGVYKLELEVLNSKVEGLKEELNREKLSKQKVEMELKGKLDIKDNEIEVLKKELEASKKVTKTTRKTKIDE